MEANSIAYLALIAFVPLSVATYAVTRSTVATAVVFVSAALLLPERVSFDPPGLPPFDKSTIPGLCALIGSLLVAARRLRRARPGRGLDLFAAVVVVGCFATVMTNGDPLTYGTTALPALTMHDGVSEAVRAVLYVAIPFFLGRALYRDPRDLEDLLGVIVLAAVAYAPLVAIELVLSPQLHRWVYGFHQHMFSQVMREGGYRPMVFMQHGLSLANFLMTATLSAATLARTRAPLPFGVPPGPVALGLGALLLACHSLGAAVYLIVCLPIVWLARPSTHRRLAAVLATIVIAYPLLRATDAFPVQALVDAAARFSQERSASLAFRFDNETLLMQKALERAWFGWGGFDRARVFSEWGQDISVTDGHWIVELGGAGIVGFVGAFGMLVVPIFRACLRLRQIAGPERVLVSGTTLITALNVVDLLPNGLYSPLPLLYAGALSGVSGALAVAPDALQEVFA